jgi:hypothetical protein
MEVVEEREAEVIVGVEAEVVGVEVVIIVVLALLLVEKEEVDLSLEIDLVPYLPEIKEDLLLDRNLLEPPNVVLLVQYPLKNILNHLQNLQNVLVLDLKDQDPLHQNPPLDLPTPQKDENLNLNLFLPVDLEVDLQRGKAHLKT